MRLTGLNNNNAEQGDSHVEQLNTGEIGVTQVENLALIPAQEITVAGGGGGMTRLDHRTKTSRIRARSIRMH